MCNAPGCVPGRRKERALYAARTVSVHFLRHRSCLCAHDRGQKPTPVGPPARFLPGRKSFHRYLRHLTVISIILSNMMAITTFRWSVNRLPNPVRRRRTGLPPPGLAVKGRRRVCPGLSAGIRQKYGITLARSVIQGHSQSIGLTSNERQKHVSEPRLDSFRRYSRKLRPF